MQPIGLCSYSAGYKAILFLQIGIEYMWASASLRGFIHAVEAKASQQIWAKVGLLTNGISFLRSQADCLHAI